MTSSEAAAQADLVVMLAADEDHGRIYAEEIAPNLREGAALSFAHGLSIRFDLITPRPDLDVFLVAPKGPGTALRADFERGSGLISLFAVHQDASGGAERLALSYAAAIGSGRVGILPTSFAEECEADLFNEQAVLWGAIPELIHAGFETLVDAGFSPEIAYFECLTEVKLLADLIYERGIAGMREAISNTAEFGALEGGTRIVTEEDAGRNAPHPRRSPLGRFHQETDRRRRKRAIRGSGLACRGGGASDRGGGQAHCRASEGLTMKMLLAALLLLCCGAASGNAAQTQAGAGNLAAAGRYRDNAGPDVVIELELARDGRFRFGIAAGSLGAQAEGRWTSDGRVVTLNTEPRPTPPTFTAGPVTRSSEHPLSILVNGPDGEGIATIDIRVGMADGRVLEGYTQSLWLAAGRRRSSGDAGMGGDFGGNSGHSTASLRAGRERGERLRLHPGPQRFRNRRIPGHRSRDHARRRSQHSFPGRYAAHGARGVTTAREGDVR